MIHAKNKPIEWVPFGAGIACEKCGEHAGKCLHVGKYGQFPLCPDCHKDLASEFFMFLHKQPWGDLPTGNELPSDSWIRRWLRGVFDVKIERVESFEEERAANETHLKKFLKWLTSDG